METVESINADHMQMTKYDRDDDPGYLAVYGVIKKCLNEELNSQGTLTVTEARTST